MHQRCNEGLVLIGGQPVADVGRPLFLWQTEGGRVAEPLLKSLGITYRKLSDPSTVAKDIQQAQSLADSSLRPVALLLTRDLMWEE